MGDKEKIFVIGHKNPDTDSICSAIAYADIKNRTSQSKKYVPMRAGHLNEETRFVLKHFGVEAPKYITNIGTQVKDMDIRISPRVNGEETLKSVWHLMGDNSIVTLPIRNEKWKLEGLVTIGDIAKTYMEIKDSTLLSDAKTQYKKIAETLEGKIITGEEKGVFDQGKVIVGMATPDKMKDRVEEHDLIILGDREETQRMAIEKKVSCMVIGMNVPIKEEIIEKAKEEGIVIITSPYDTFNICRQITQSIPVRYIMQKGELITFSTDEFTDDIQEVMIRHKHRAFPVINKKGECIGTISRRNFLDMHRKKVILVDHNERDQAVDNIEKAEIEEIIDHHKLGSLETMKPISFRNKPVGCTATILYQIYDEQKLEISPVIAGLLCSAIISDTLMFRSPTCTLQDKMAAGALALIADIDITDHAKKMFKAGSNLREKSSEEIFYQDYKKFVGDGEFAYGVGQISSMDSEELLEIEEKLRPVMISECGRNGITKVFFMLTNILEKSTRLLYYGEESEELIRTAFEKEPENGAFYLEGIVSRKKQLIPSIMEAIQIMESDF